ncbi:hypothetical protein CANINC_000205 [Pichia inconspicua]|uniref:Uncharacterized protein n=1 Tax=Pichia inconspicua TaxID=52247 RepID=A0A4T0X8K4_9ASCO|nr:hypothetical protein CANINC_000205 [[Candida] inconspicua]
MVEYKVNNPRSAEINVLPASIKFTGIVPNGKITWEKSSEKELVDGATVNYNYLRGRKLIGTENDVSGKAIVFEKDRKSTGEMKYVGIAQSDKITTFDHHFRGSLENNQIKRISEWIEISKIINE